MSLAQPLRNSPSYSTQQKSSPNWVCLLKCNHNTEWPNASSSGGGSPCPNKHGTNGIQPALCHLWTTSRGFTVSEPSPLTERTPEQRRQQRQRQRQLHSSIPPCAQARMGCSTSTHTSAVDTSRPSAKPEEMNGATVTGDLQNFNYTLIPPDKQVIARPRSCGELLSCILIPL